MSPDFLMFYKTTDYVQQNKIPNIFDYTTIANRLRTFNFRDYSHQTDVTPGLWSQNSHSNKSRVKKRIHLKFCKWWMVVVNWLFNVTINDISVIYVTAHRCAGGLKKKLDLRSDSKRHRHSVGFFNVPVLAPTGTTLFIRWFRHTAPFSRLLRSRWGYGGHILDLTPGPSRGKICK